MLPSLVILTGYLLGSIPFGYLLVRVTQGADVRATGSGGTGATNVSRRAGKWAGVVTLLLDALKGIAAVIVARMLLAGNENDVWLISATGLASIVGHIFPVWLNFRGGKGVATGLGVFSVLTPAAVACAAVVFFIVVLLTRYVSLASISATLSLPLFVWLLHRFDLLNANSIFPLIIATALGGLLIVWMHRANINRLMNNTESKFK